ncbi:unnamed protein product [Prorocentrum cordatum]|uniref:Uncharacterized protein n=1 Tax=Prorocentrum cordatum TaxID=2364126 RepID=A0ABN9SAC3_9DINO|nr:unnamed protein product [Polarella glacialis]
MAPAAQDFVSQRRSVLQAQVNSTKPATAQMFAITTQIENVAKQIGKQQRLAEQQKVNIESLQTELQTVESPSQEKRARLVELRAQHLELAKQATAPPQGNARGSTAAPITASGLDAAKLGEVLRSLGAGAQTMAMARSFGGAEADVEELKNMVLEAGVQAPEEEQATRSAANRLLEMQDFSKFNSFQLY